MQHSASAQDAVPCRREDDRAPILQPSTLRISDAPHDVRVEDLSPNGFAFSSTVPIPIDTIVHVGLAGAGRASARIVRRADTVYGCIFEPGLTSAQIEDAFTRSPSDTVTTLAARASAIADDGEISQPQLPFVTRIALLALASLMGWLVFATALRSLPFS
ncbi:MAG: PilZ domain-containing protein [Oxalobacteraceae bacterium]|uniref:PilZ domain-containing protein n=1 Tax=Sphingomonas sp. Leaf208 TaxID=1735679 RepID=UPI0009EA7439|nr:MAG: PilZ domain-containing protein [Oxalobacteraceae bacterium]